MFSTRLILRPMDSTRRAPSFRIQTSALRARLRLSQDALWSCRLASNSEVLLPVGGGYRCRPHFLPMAKRSLQIILVSLLFCAQGVPQQPPRGSEVVRVDLSAPSTPFPHFWEQVFGSGRANLAL